MPTQYPTFTVNGQTVRLTRTVAVRLAAKARQYGHLNRGHDPVSNATVVEVTCPLCRGAVRGYSWPRRASTAGMSPEAALNVAVIEHLTLDCPEVDRP